VARPRHIANACGLNNPMLRKIREADARLTRVGVSPRSPRNGRAGDRSSPNSLPQAKSQNHKVRRLPGRGADGAVTKRNQDVRSHQDGRQAVSRGPQRQDPDRAAEGRCRRSYRIQRCADGRQ
jgi:hypothetical protein